MANNEASHLRMADVFLSVGIGAVLLLASQAERVRDGLATVEGGLTGRATLSGSLYARGAARTFERAMHAAEAETFDRRLELRSHFAPPPVDSRILIVEIEDSSLARHGRWPWPRDLQGHLVEGLFRHGARGALLDIEFPEHSGEGAAREPDQVLARSFSRGPTHGMMFTGNMPVLESDMRRQRLENRIVEWTMSGAGMASTAVFPEDVRGLLKDDKALASHADDLARIGRHLMRRSGADLMDLLRTGVLPDVAPPKAPTGPGAPFPALVLPAALGIVSKFPDQTVDALVERVGTATGLVGADGVAQPPVRPYLKAVVGFLIQHRRRLSDLGLTVLRMREQLLDRQVLLALHKNPHASLGEVVDQVSRQLGVPPEGLEGRLARLLDRRRSLQAIRARDLVTLGGEMKIALPGRGPITPPIPPLAQAYTGVGLSVTQRDIDGSVRTQPLFYRIDETFPDLSDRTVALQATLAPAALLLNLDLEGARLDDGWLSIPARGQNPHSPGAAGNWDPATSLPPGSLRVPVDDQGRVVIDMRGAWKRDGFASITAAQVLEVRALSDKRDTFLRGDPSYLMLHILGDWFDKMSPFGGPLGPLGLVPSPGVPRSFFVESWQRFGHDLERDRAAARRARFDQLALDVKSYVQAVADAQKDGDQQTEREAQAELDRVAPLFDLLLVRLPLLEDELRRAVTGRFCLVGSTATSTTDISVVPLDERYMNLGIHVNVLNQLLQGSTLRRASTGLVDVPLLFLYMVILALGLTRLSIRMGAALAMALVAGHSALCIALMLHRSIWIQAGLPILAVSLSYAAITLRRYFLEERQKLKIRAMFETYLDPKVVEMMVDDESLWRELGGTVREITPFFSDLAQFSPMAELLGPEELSDMLADYLTPMTDIILKHGGIRERYVGDAIVAFFGAPVVFPDHAAKACLASLEQREALAVLRQQWWQARVPWYVKIRAAGLDLDFRIGLTTGMAKVGNFGSKFVKNYSMNGDIVNLAARLEGANKFYGTGILCTEETYLAASTVVEAREVDLLKVVGKKQSAKIYELMGRKGQMLDKMTELLESFSKALALYRARRFDEARAAFTAVLQAHPGDGPTQTYLGRLADASALAALPEDWDGSWTAQTK